MKQFKTKEELDNYIDDKTPDVSFENILEFDYFDHIKKIAETLEADGYDLDNLVEDGHGYELAGHTNNGWLYEDEADMEYIKSEGIQVEIRKR